MEFKVYYDKMTLDEVNRFNGEWRLLDANIENKSFFEKNVLNSWLKNDGGFKKALTAETHDKYIGDKTRDYLKYKVLGYSKFDRDIEQDLIAKYIIIGNEIPADFVSMMLEYVRSLATTLINDEPIKVIATPFLKLLLMINYFHFNELEIGKGHEKVERESELVSQQSLINYLKVRQILIDNDKHINTTKLSQWLENEDASIQDYYKYLTVQLNAKSIFEFFHIIIKIFNNSEQWIVINVFEEIFINYKREVDIGVKLGLIILRTYEKKQYMKFSPEGWFLATGERPILWNKKDILITPLKEVFIPFNFNPFIIQKFDYFDYINAEKDNKKIVFCEDYFMVSKLPKIQEIEDSTQIAELAGYIKEYCEDIPDLIRYELDLGKQQRFDPNKI